MTRLRVSIASTLSVALVLLVATACFSHPKTVEDGAQDLGPSSTLGLDIKQVTQDHNRYLGNRVLTLTVEMQQAFSNQDLAQPSCDAFAISFHIDTDKDDLFDRVIAVDVQPDSSDEGMSPLAFVVRKPPEPSHLWEATGRLLGFAQVWRPTEASLSVRLPVTMLGKEAPRSFGWAARAASGDPNDASACGYDYAPDEGTTSGHSAQDD
ncbi:MAG TPA: hypothetical protein VNC78_02100 [Actinomycetota bacterium]|nr:hypothetical protein [Actinomycetota bacterium]